MKANVAESSETVGPVAINFSGTHRVALVCGSSTAHGDMRSRVLRRAQGHS